MAATMYDITTECPPQPLYCKPDELTCFEPPPPGKMYGVESCVSATVGCPVPAGGPAPAPAPAAALQVSLSQIMSKARTVANQRMAATKAANSVAMSKLAKLRAIHDELQDARGQRLKRLGLLELEDEEIEGKDDDHDDDEDHDEDEGEDEEIEGEDEPDGNDDDSN